MSNTPSFTAWFIPGNVPSSKNSRRWTGKFFIASKTVMKYRKNSSKEYKKHAASFTQEFNKYETPVYVSFTFTRGTKHKFDHINPLQTVQDEMTKHGWIEDDNANIIIPANTPTQHPNTNMAISGILFHFIFLIFI